MISFASAVFVAILAVVAASYSILGTLGRAGQSRAGLLHPADQEKYTPSFFGVEAFYRTLLINLSIVSFSIAAFTRAAPASVGFWDWENPLLWLGIVFLFGLFVALIMHDDYEALRASRRRVFVTVVCTILGVALFAVVVGVSRLAGAAPVSISRP